MYGVGQNPVYLERLAEREAKRAASGEAAAEAKEAAAAEKARFSLPTAAALPSRARARAATLALPLV